MKWPSVPVNKKLIGALLLLAAFMSAGIAMWPAKSQTPFNSHGDVQLGFYDLMAQRKEIYDSRMQTVGSTILTTITSPDDSSFVLKGKFTRLGTENGKIFFAYTPIYSGSPHAGIMIDGLVDLLMHVDVWMEPLRLKNQPIVVGQSGMIFLYPISR